MKVFAKETHFFSHHDRVFADHGFETVESIADADLVLGQTRRRLSLYSVRYPTKAFALIVEDPRSERTNAAYFCGLLGKKIHLLNVFSGAFFWDNYPFSNMFGIGQEALTEDIEASHFEDPQRKKRLCAILAYSNPLYQAPAPPVGTNLHRFRRDLVEAFYEEGFADISGRDWPIESEPSLDDFQAVGFSWADLKMQKISHYWYVLSIENTLCPHYVTEKIWQSIIAGALPLYYGGGTSTIYEDFPKDSFIDAAEFDSRETLLDYLRSLSAEEAARRLRSCRQAYNAMLERKPASHEAYQQQAKENMCRRLRELVKK